MSVQVGEVSLLSTWQTTNFDGDMLTNLLSGTKGASQALTYHPWLIISHALSSGLLKHPGSVELLLELKTHLHIICSRPVQAGRLGNPNPVLNIHETYLPHLCHSICPPEAHQPPSLGQHSLICPQEVCLTLSLGTHTCLCVLWHACQLCHNTPPACTQHHMAPLWVWLSMCTCLACMWASPLS